MHDTKRRSHPSNTGFTLVELLVSMAIFVLILVGVLTVFDLNSRLARVHTKVAEMQQSHRVAQYDILRTLRMAGRGGLPPILRPNPDDGATPTPAFPGRLFPTGLSVFVQNNVGAGTTIAGAGTPLVLEGTDVLGVRGVFTSSIYQVNPAGGAFALTGNTGTLTLDNLIPETGVPQDLTPVAEAIRDINAGGEREALLMASPLEDAINAVVEITGGNTIPAAGSPVTQVTINFTITGGIRTAQYMGLTPDGVYPATMTTVAFAGILEEYRFYIRAERVDPLDATSELAPLLSRARVYPGSNVAHELSASNLREDIADNILDLQVALGIDANSDSLIIEGTDAASKAVDDWLFNHANDNPGVPTNPLNAATINWNGASPSDVRAIYYVRITTLARSDRRDPSHAAALLTTLEDKDYSVIPFADANTRANRMYRRRVMQTIVDLRNLS